ncbi:hypothetical protein [Natronococcus sp. A-GB7]|uniref:hypothetical protein n=1 Tax=Natronococcus sp. A-GB7 TaxID=3037649 RepID=UPI00241C79B3|nr:hypothetical protein [Natronococcus sp. A-GB7]MDG5821631.1 hypothetical protein [Natronococcus sp. A-GB7]
MLNHNPLPDVCSGLRECIARNYRVPSLVMLLSTLMLTMSVAAQEEDFCSTEAGEMLGNTVGFVGAIVVMMLVIGLLVGGGLEALPLTGGVARIAHRIVGGLFVGIFVLVLGFSFLQFGLGYSVIDTGMACTPLD